MDVKARRYQSQHKRLLVKHVVPKRLMKSKDTLEKLSVEKTFYDERASVPIVNCELDDVILSPDFDSVQFPS